jgi:protein-disulfide isomerase
MSRRNQILSLLAACLIPAACTSQAAAPPPGRAAGSGDKPQFDAAPEQPKPVAAAAAAPAPAAAPLPPGTGAASCEAARLALDPSAVIAKLDGKDIKASELGGDLAKAETAALRTYCDSVGKLRQQALDSMIDERLLEAAAKKASFAGGGDAWLQAEVAKQVEQPSDADIQAFYDANKTETAPPLDQVKAQVVAAMVEEPTQKALQGILGGLRKEVGVEKMLPDVSAPPLDLRDADTTAGFGPKDAKVHVVEFSDFECPYCVRAATAVSGLKDTYGDRVRFSYRHFPLSFHPAARPAAEMAQCAVAQDKFWGFHDAVFAAGALDASSLRGAAEKAGMDLEALDTCMKSGKAGEQVDADMKLAGEVGVSGTPNFFINGRAFEGGPGQLAAAIEAELQRG